MTDRWSYFAASLVSAFLALSSVACDDEIPSTPPTLHTDLAALKRLITLPDGVTSARWLVKPLRPPGSRLVPGPTDAMLFAYLETEPDFWTKQGGQLPVLTSGKAPHLMPDIAKLLLPAAILKEASLENGSYRLNCEPRTMIAFDSPGHHGRLAARCDTGLLLVFQSN